LKEKPPGQVIAHLPVETGEAALNDLTVYSLTGVGKKLNLINVRVNLKHHHPFPKPPLWRLSHYAYRKRFVKITPQGYYDKSKLISSLIDFSFVRSLTAHGYSPFPPFCYDPPSLFLLDIFRWLDSFSSMAEFCNRLHHQENGRCYRTYAGISDDNIPCPATFSNFRARLGEPLYNRIFHILIEIVEALGLITARILSHDGSLFPTAARYKGCNYACPDCLYIKVTDKDFIHRERHKILSLLENPSKIDLTKERRAYAKCPRADSLPQDIHPPSTIVMAYKLFPFDPELVDEKDQTAKLLGVEEALSKAKLRLIPIRSNISKIELNLKDNPFYVKCSRVPADLTAKVGYRRSKYHPHKKEKVFGFLTTITTSVEPETGLELPIAVITEDGSHHDGNLFIALREQIKKYHPDLETHIDIGDAGFDDTDNYEYSRDDGSLPIFTYNPRNENLTQNALQLRGYDDKGYPYAPCKATCKPHGYDKDEKRLSFICAKQCLSSPQAVPEPMTDCPHLNNSNGFATHMPISKNPRLITEIPRGSKRWKKIYNIRTSSERTNSAAKTDLDVINKPVVMGVKRARILAVLACIATLIKKLLHFIINITLTLRKAINSSDSQRKYWKALKLRAPPACIARIINKT